MDTQELRIAICHDAGDGSGDLILEIPPSIIQAMGLRIGDSVELEIVDGLLVLTPLRDAQPDA
ncbi:AbrB/MazE/SpoVT family DNA-binding domain-containing protein [Pseudomonas sp. J452]|uniref:AbrB/MazE/SpoVT family DNA-binding domain-containing protein n=1 Tax=Pseudomonas sp. J452 TaxID=2898441 RepID=UPI0021AD60CE|nr:AbrB/MazE/SpoVT family DNA-binding domain-containing protein [Pseudomonas sp. J452]UUY07703.1 AbrB/MazE/SpoVT family DNA-binding domain-containing protein [Pseudomonas sp. J452]